jgi:hypothetical protein
MPPCPTCVVVHDTCTDRCAADAVCTTCGLLKRRSGRADANPNTCTTTTCRGYRAEPTPPHLWPHELALHHNHLKEQ